MKKIIKSVIAMTFIVGLIGCSGSSTKKPNEVLKLLEDGNCTIYFKISDSDNYYTNDLKVYKPAKDENSGLVYPGEMVLKPRLFEEPKEITSMEIRKGIASSFTISDNGESLQYMFNNIIYLKNPATEEEDYIVPNQGTDNKQIKEQYTKELESLGITDKELLEFFKWSKDNTQKDFLEKLKTSFNEQPPLTAEDVETIFKDNNISIGSTEDGTAYVAAEELGIFILGDTGTNNERISFQVINYQEFVSSAKIDKATIYFVFLDSTQETTMTYDMTVLYDLNNNKVIAGSDTEIKKLLEDCNNLKTKFLELLSTCHISLEQFKNFIKEY